MEDNRSRQYHFMQAILKLLLLFSLISVVGMTFIYYETSNLFIHRKNEKPIEKLSDIKGFDYEEVTFKSREGNVTLKGIFFSTNPSSNKTVIAIHGFDEDRLMDGRTKMLVKYLIPRGYNVLAFDLRGHGQSEGDLISFGYYEKYDVLGAIDYLKQRGKEGEKIALLGFSMGAITAIEAAGEDERVNALIADSPIRDLKLFIAQDINNISNNLDTVLTNYGGPAYCSIIRYFPFKSYAIIRIAELYDLNISQVSPMSTVKNIAKKPIFLIHSKNDKFISYTNSEAIYQSLQNHSHASIWFTEKAEHIGSLKMYPEEYLGKIGAFLNDNM